MLRWWCFLSMPRMFYCFICMPNGWEALSMPTDGCSVCMSTVIINSKLRSAEQDSVPYRVKKAERQLLQDSVKAINSILQDNTLRLDRCGSRLAFLVTSTRMGKCTNVIKKVRESRFAKAMDRQVNKINRLMGKD